MDTLIVPNSGKNDDEEYITGQFIAPAWLLILGGKREHFAECAEAILRWIATTGNRPPVDIQDMEQFVESYLAKFRPQVLAQMPNQTCRGCFWKVQMIPKGQVFHAVFMHDEESESKISPGFEVVSQLN